MLETNFSPGVLEGLEITLKHPAPYSDRELDSVEHIQVMNDRLPRGLERLVGLRQMHYRGCEVVDLEVLQHLPHVWGLNGWASNITSVARLPTLAPRVDWVDFTVGQLRDLRPLLELPLKHAALAGNPIDEESFRYVYPELIRRGAVRDPAKTPEFLIHEREWELMQLFVARGLRLSAYQVGGRTRIAAPGHIVYEKPEGTGVNISVRQARQLLEANPEIDERGFLGEVRRLKSVDGYVE